MSSESTKINGNQLTQEELARIVKEALSTESFLIIFPHENVGVSMMRSNVSTSHALGLLEMAKNVMLQGVKVMPHSRF